jgi:hypothetical protein
VGAEAHELGPAGRLVGRRQHLVGQADRPVGAPRGRHRAGGVEQAAKLFVPLRAETGRDLERRPGRARGRADTSDLRGALEVSGDLLVGLDRRPGEVPGAPAELAPLRQPLGEGAVGPAPLGRTRRPVGDAAEQRVTELESRPLDRDETCGLRGLDGLASRSSRVRAALRSRSSELSLAAATRSA